MHSKLGILYKFRLKHTIFSLRFWRKKRRHYIFKNLYWWKLGSISRRKIMRIEKTICVADPEPRQIQKPDPELYQRQRPDPDRIKVKSCESSSWTHGGSEWSRGGSEWSYGGLSWIRVGSLGLWWRARSGSAKDLESTLKKETNRILVKAGSRSEVLHACKTEPRQSASATLKKPVLKKSQYQKCELNALSPDPSLALLQTGGQVYSLRLRPAAVFPASPDPAVPASWRLVWGGAGFSWAGRGPGVGSPLKEAAHLAQNLLCHNNLL